MSLSRLCSPCVFAIFSWHPFICSLRVGTVFDHFGYPAPALGDWKHAKWSNLRLVLQMVEDMQHRVSTGLIPLPSLQLATVSQPSVPPPPYSLLSGTSTMGVVARPEVALKAPRSAAGKAQFSAAQQQRGSGGGSKGICLEEATSPSGTKRRRREGPADSTRSYFPNLQDTFEDSDDSSESYDGPFPHVSSSTIASSTTTDAGPSTR